MAGTKISALAALTTVADGDLLPIVDVSDPGSGTTKRTAALVVADYVKTKLPWYDASAYGVIGDGSTNDTAAIQDLVDEVHTAGGGFIRFAEGTYRLATAIEVWNTVTLEGWGYVKFDFDSFTGDAVTIKPATTPGTPMATVLRNLVIQGSTVTTAPVFTAGQHGIRVSSPFVQLQQVRVQGFDSGFTFGDPSYIITFDTCSAWYNNEGVTYDWDSFSEAGEKIVFDNCLIAANNSGIYNNLGELEFVGCSIDYNIDQTIRDNITAISGATSTTMRFTNCHLESGGALTSAERILNSGYMCFENTTWFDDFTSAPTKFYITNAGGRVVIGRGCMIRVAHPGYLVNNTGVGMVITDGALPVSVIGVSQLSPQNSRITNSTFETTDLTGWTITAGTGAANSATEAHLGTRSLRMTRTDGATGTNIQTAVAVPPGAQYAAVSWWWKNLSGASISVNIYQYDRTAVYLGLVSITGCAVNTDWERKLPFITLDQRCTNLLIQIAASTGSTTFGYFDDFYAEYS